MRLFVEPGEVKALHEIAGMSLIAAENRYIGPRDSQSSVPEGEQGPCNVIRSPETGSQHRSHQRADTLSGLMAQVGAIVLGDSPSAAGQARDQCNRLTYGIGALEDSGGAFTTYLLLVLLVPKAQPPKSSRPSSAVG